MSKFSKVLYLCAILLLGWLAVLPYWPTIREEALNFYTAWQQIRSSEEQKPDLAQSSGSEKENARKRAIAAPKPAELLPTLVANTSAAESLDPFIREARERAKEDPEAAMQWLQEQSTGAERLRGMLEVVALWAAKDSETALFWLESNAQGIARLETLNSGVELWAQRDPKAAAGWIDGMANDGSKIAAAKSLASTWAKSNPEEASKWVLSLPFDGVRYEATSALTLSWMKTDPESALTWAERATRGGIFYGDNEHAFIQGIVEYARIAPGDAEKFVRQVQKDPFEAPDYYPNYVRQFIEARASQDPAETANWLQTLPDDDPIRYRENTTTLMKVWTETDSIAASAWLSEQPLGAERDAAIVGFAETIQKFEPEAAATWADTISDPNKRTAQLKQSIRTWAKEKPDAALEWVINSDLAPAEKEQLAREIGFD